MSELSVIKKKYYANACDKLTAIVNFWFIIYFKDYNFQLSYNIFHNADHAYFKKRYAIFYIIV